MAQNVFNINRFTNFILRQGTFNVQPILIGIGGIFGILMLISFLTAYFQPHELNGMIPLYLVVFFIGGFIFTSRVFAELNSSHRSYAFLTLPVSTFEKALGSWVLSSPLYSVVYLALVSVIFFISTIIAGRPAEFLEFFREPTFITMGVYMVVQTLFFLGACVFYNYNFIKTLFSLFLICMGLGLFTLLIVLILFGGHIEGNFNGDNSGDQFNEIGEVVFTQIIPFIFWYLLGPFLLIVSYFKLKERQA